jgi:uncharacterized protein (TIGR00251 family)
MVGDLFEIAARHATSDAGGDGAGDTPEPETGDVVLHLHVQPGAGRSAVVGRHGDALKVRVAAPPTGGRANEQCGALLAETFGVKPAQVELAGGASSRAKRFRIRDVELHAFERRLEQLVQEGQAGPGPDARHANR